MPLLYKRDLIETWNGVDLHLWLLEHDLKYNFASTYRGNYEPFWQQELQDFGGAEAFKKLDFLDKKFGFLSDKLKIIDLRVKDRMIIKLNVGDTNFKESKV